MFGLEKLWRSAFTLKDHVVQRLEAQRKVFSCSNPTKGQEEIEPELVKIPKRSIDR
jgi:hypothetical protein